MWGWEGGITERLARVLSDPVYRGFGPMGRRMLPF